MPEPARNLRTAERFLIAPPLAASLRDVPVSVCDISTTGARVRHAQVVETGSKALLKIAANGAMTPVILEATVVWTEREGSPRESYVSGLRTYGSPEALQSLLVQLQAANRMSRIEELRSTERFHVRPLLPAHYGSEAIVVENLSARGAGIELPFEPRRGTTSELRFSLPQSNIEVTVEGEIVWTAVKAISGGTTSSYRAGVRLLEKPEFLRLAIGHLCDTGRAALDTKSLQLKLKILRARARQNAPAFAGVERSGLPAEQYLLIQGVREELRLNPEEAMHWYRRARLIINDPSTREVAPPIAGHPDALAVWEYLDRSVDPSVVGRAFELNLP